MQLQLFHIFILSLLFIFAKATIYKEHLNFGEKVSVKRNQTIRLEFASSPFKSSFFWNYTLSNGSDAEAENQFCQANPREMASELLFKFPTPRSNEAYGKAAFFEHPNETLIFLSDIAHHNLNLVTFKEDSNDPTIGEVRFTNSTDPTKSDFQYELSKVKSHHLLKIDNDKLLLSVNSQVKVFKVTPTERMQQMIWGTLNTKYPTAIISHKEYLYVASDKIEVYLLADSTLRLVSTISPEDFPFSPKEFNVASLAVDLARQILFVAEITNGIYLIDLSKNLTKPHHITQMKSSMSFANAKRMILSEVGILLVELGEDSGHSTIYELAPDDPEILNAEFKVLRKHGDLPNINYITSDENLGFVTFTNLVLVFMLGIPEPENVEMEAMAQQISHYNVQFAMPYHFSGGTYLFSASKNQFEIHEISYRQPSMSCSPPTDIPTQTYKMEGMIYSLDCQAKSNNTDNSLFSYCETQTLIPVEVWDDPLISTPMDFSNIMIGVAIGIFVFVFLLGFCVYYYCKAKKYQRLFDQDSARVKKTQNEMESFSI